MKIEKRDGHKSFASVIKAGLVVIGRAHAQAGHQVFLPGPDWTPEDGADGLVAVKIEKVNDDVAVGKDGDGQTWALWL